MAPATFDRVVAGLQELPELREVVLGGYGEQALYVARHEAPDLVVLDILMPRMDGLEFTRWKGMPSFLAVILVAVGTVAILAGRVAETEFRRYALVHGGLWNRQAVELAAYYADSGSWGGPGDRACTPG